MGIRYPNPKYWKAVDKSTLRRSCDALLLSVEFSLVQIARTSVVTKDYSSSGRPLVPCSNQRPAVDQVSNHRQSTTERGCVRKAVTRVWNSLSSPGRLVWILKAVFRRGNTGEGEGVARDIDQKLRVTVVLVGAVVCKDPTAAFPFRQHMRRCLLAARSP